MEVEKHVKLIVLSEGRETPTSELMHQTLRSLDRVLDLGYEFQRRQRIATLAGEIPSREHMAVRGAAGGSYGPAPLNGNYAALPGTVGGRVAYERTTRDLYLFYHDVTESWCIGTELAGGAAGANQNIGGNGVVVLDPSTILAMVQDYAETPDAISHAWEVFDHDLHEFKTDSGLQTRCGTSL